MKKYFSFLLMVATILLLFSCKSTKSSVSASEKSETMALQSYRLTSSLMIDTFSKYLTLSVDSMVMVLGIRETFTPDTQQQALKVYGLHVGAGTDKKSVQQASLEDSKAVAMQSSEIKKASKQKSKPSSTPKYLFYMLLIALAIWLIYKLRS